MITAFSLLLHQCGLSHREAAELLAVRPDTVKSWSAGRNRVPSGVLAALRDLHGRQRRAAGEALAMIQASGDETFVELGHASDDAEAQALGWPCVGAHLAVLGMVVAGTTAPVAVAPRGSTPGTAAASDAHEI